jgi:hypothetical protein
MPDDTPPDGAPPPERAGETPGGYHYTVVNDDATAPAESAHPAPGRAPALRWLALAALAIVPAAIVGVVVWSVMRGSDSSDGRASSDVANILSAFSQGNQDSVTTRFERTVPDGYPSDIPTYPNARVVSALVQTQGEDASYIVVYDTTDTRDAVASWYQDALEHDPWQITFGQETRESAIRGFDKTDDPDVSGVVLVSESKGGGLTTILTSVQITSGAKDAEKQPFETPATRALPEGFPADIPDYQNGILFEAAYQKRGGGNQFLVSYVTKDSADDVIAFYKDKLGAAGFSVTDDDARSSPLEDAQAISFVDSSSSTQGEVTVGNFPEDDSYRRIDLRVSATR